MYIQAMHSLRAGVMAIAPVLLLAALGYHPYLASRQPNIDALAAEVIADPTRWGVVHLATGSLQQSWPWHFSRSEVTCTS